MTALVLGNQGVQSVPLFAEEQKPEGLLKVLAYFSQRLIRLRLSLDSRLEALSLRNP